MPTVAGGANRAPRGGGGGRDRLVDAGPRRGQRPPGFPVLPAAALGDDLGRQVARRHHARGGQRASWRRSPGWPPFRWRPSAATTATPGSARCSTDRSRPSSSFSSSSPSASRTSTRPRSVRARRGWRSTSSCCWRRSGPPGATSLPCGCTASSATDDWDIDAAPSCPWPSACSSAAWPRSPSAVPTCAERIERCPSASGPWSASPSSPPRATWQWIRSAGPADIRASAVTADPAGRWIYVEGSAERSGWYPHERLIDTASGRYLAGPEPELDRPRRRDPLLGRRPLRGAARPRRRERRGDPLRPECAARLGSAWCAWSRARLQPGSPPLPCPRRGRPSSWSTNRARPSTRSRLVDAWRPPRSGRAGARWPSAFSRRARPGRGSFPPGSEK